VPSALGTAIQVELQRLGYEIGIVDGRVGPRVRVAIIDFQRQQGLLVTGQPTGALLQSLRQAR
jgi:peptidoglycan hydrolase-like protein with peptidoglycan-binding domain